ncbi:hypothetical protein CS390_09570 [Pseudomonas sp. HLS-6]|uniref:hypothetical protein n=1 Tax=Pseudomonas sp. HLS-6 TaxID=2049589 RepID=UPI000C19174C|nr:hypothetical protein [Pseudomonas sp. HLS-6]ATR82788.1 hypothetical protein CS390_09570 [Pseudomonas sp. HLS-6]
MGITIANKPELDINGTRWVEIAPGAKILVGSTASPLYKSNYALIQRHLASIDMQTRVGTKDFSIADAAPVVFEQEDEMLVDLVSTHLIKAWEGIDEVDNPGVPAPYSPALCKALIRQMPNVYFLAIKTGSDIARRIEEKAQVTAEKQ